jgi:hypothetical protein
MRIAFSSPNLLHLTTPNKIRLRLSRFSLFFEQTSTHTLSFHECYRLGPLRCFDCPSQIGHLGVTPAGLHSTESPIAHAERMQRKVWTDAGGGISISPAPIKRHRDLARRWVSVGDIRKKWKRENRARKTFRFQLASLKGVFHLR